MERVKKQVQLKTTTGSTSNGIVIIPDLTVSYNFKILLKSEGYDFGFFDALPLNQNPYYYGTNNPIGLENLL